MHSVHRCELLLEMPRYMVWSLCMCVCVWPWAVWTDHCAIWWTESRASNKPCIGLGTYGCHLANTVEQNPYTPPIVVTITVETCCYYYTWSCHVWNDGCGWCVKVSSADGAHQVGKISKQWTGFFKQYFTDAKNFDVSCTFIICTAYCVLWLPTTKSWGSIRLKNLDLDT